MNVVVNNQSRSEIEVTEQRNSDGTVEIAMLVRREVAKGIGEGAFD